MARKDRISMDRHAQILELYHRGYSIRRIAQTLKMCKKSVRKYVNRPLTQPNTLSILQSDPQTSLASPVDPNAIILQFPIWFQNLDWQTLVKERL